MNSILNQVLSEIDFAVVDLETTGLCRKNDCVIEVAAVKIIKGKIAGHFQSLIYTDYVPYAASRVHGIDADMLADAPSLSSVKKEFINFINGCVLVGHNIKSFDMPFLQNSFGISEKAACVDTLKLSRIVFAEERSHRLSIVAERLGIKSLRYHRALDDTMTTAKVFLKLIKKGDSEFKILKDIIA